MTRRFLSALAVSLALIAAGAIAPASAKPRHSKTTTGGIATTDANAYPSDVNYNEPTSNGGGDDRSMAIVAVSGGAVLILGIAAYRRRRPASA